MIRTRIRMYGSRTVVILAEPTHPALAAPALARSRRPESACGGEAIEQAVRDLSRRFAVHLLGAQPAPFRHITG